MSTLIYKGTKDVRAPRSSPLMGSSHPHSTLNREFEVDDEGIVRRKGKSNS